MTPRTRIALIFGGASSEHGISCLTAASVLNAIDQTRYDVVGIGISPTGRWRQVELDTIGSYAIVNGKPPEVAEPQHDAVWMLGKDGCEVATRDGEKLVDISGVDVAFALLHGPFGEDGTIQGMFEMMGIRYVGCGVTSSAVGMDKHFMRMAFQAAGLPVGPWVAVTDQQWRFTRDEILKRVRTLELPVFVKPARGGSSIGISRVTAYDDIPAAIEQARHYDPKVIIEQGIEGREIECAVLGEPTSPQGCITSSPGEVRVLVNDGFYDYDTKYFDQDGAALDIPARIPEPISARIQQLAAQAFRALDCEGLARADFFLTPDGQVFINEVNTMPGFTQISMFPSLWHHSGLQYPQLISRLIELALERRIGLR